MNKRIALTVSQRATIAVASIAALATLSVNAQTTPVNDDEVPMHVVNYDDLDLADDADAKALYRRLQAAAKDVCHVYAAPRAAVLNKVDQQCKREALATAVARVGHPSLTALHLERGGMKLARVKSDSVRKPALASKSVAVPASAGG